MGLLIGLIIWALFVAASYFVGKQKGRVGAGVALAALLGVAGGMATLLIRSTLSGPTGGCWPGIPGSSGGRTSRRSSRC